jgi:hypothetical protein
VALSPTQKGKIAEMVVGAAIMHASDGRLAPFVPLADDNGLDLILFDKLSGATTPVQVKARFSKDFNNTCEFNIRVSACKAHYNSYLLAVYINPRSMTLSGAWLVHTSALPAVAPRENGKYILRASLSERANDRAAPYRHFSVESIVAEIAAPIPTLSQREPRRFKPAAYERTPTADTRAGIR